MKIFLFGVVFYLVLLALMFAFQRRLMYFPEKNPATPDLVGLSHIENISLTSEDGTRLQAWHARGKANMPMVVYFHGNAGTLLNRAITIRDLNAEGFHVLAVSYRGYGSSDGEPSQDGIYADSRAIMRHAIAMGHAPETLVLFGESLGTGVAVKMASEFGARAIALQSPYTSVADRAAEIYRFIPVRRLIRDRFESREHLTKLNIPLIVFHGEIDKTITPHHGKAMLEASPSMHKEGHFFPNVGHTEFDTAVLARLLHEFINRAP